MEGIGARILLSSFSRASCLKSLKHTGSKQYRQNPIVTTASINQRRGFSSVFHDEVGSTNQNLLFISAARNRRWSVSSTNQSRRLISTCQNSINESRGHKPSTTCSTNHHQHLHPRGWYNHHQISSVAQTRNFCTPPPASLPSTLTSPPTEEACTLVMQHGLPHLTVPLPSRRELCCFPLRPLSHSVGCLADMLRREDRGVDRVLVRTLDGVRMASSARIESIMLADFELVLNDVVYRVAVPEYQVVAVHESQDLADTRALVQRLYSSMHVGEHQLSKEREMVLELETIKEQLMPLEETRAQLLRSSERRTSLLMFSGLGYMALQFGFLARLTWWEYSWDIMEPVTYFVTYGTAIVCYAYYCITRHEFLLPEVRDRQTLLGLHSKARSSGFDLRHYNQLKDRLYDIEADLARLRDPLGLHLPTAGPAQPAQATPSASPRPSPFNMLKNMFRPRSS